MCTLILCHLHRLSHKICTCHRIFCCVYISNSCRNPLLDLGNHKVVYSFCRYDAIVRIILCHLHRLSHKICTCHRIFCCVYISNSCRNPLLDLGNHKVVYSFCRYGIPDEFESKVPKHVHHMTNRSVFYVSVKITKAHVLL